jgi:hypothetical protein
MSWVSGAAPSKLVGKFGGGGMQAPSPWEVANLVSWVLVTDEWLALNLELTYTLMVAVILDFCLLITLL